MASCHPSLSRMAWRNDKLHKNNWAKKIRHMQVFRYTNNKQIHDSYISVSRPIQMGTKTDNGDLMDRNHTKILQVWRKMLQSMMKQGNICPRGKRETKKRKSTPHFKTFFFTFARFHCLSKHDIWSPILEFSTNNKIATHDTDSEEKWVNSYLDFVTNFSRKLRVTNDEKRTTSVAYVKVTHEVMTSYAIRASYS